MKTQHRQYYKHGYAGQIFQRIDRRRPAHGLIEEQIGIVCEREYLAKPAHRPAHGHQREGQARKRKGQNRIAAADRKGQPQIAQHRNEQYSQRLIGQDEQ